MAILDRIHYPSDLKDLSIEELKSLCEEIRNLIIDTTSKCGGHLASSLGAVELTVALYYVFDFPKDIVVWDVGHQAYAHKILTGRKDVFHTLRSYKGIAGFPKREESPYDIVTCGHSSTSISIALGIACGRDLKNGKENIIAVIGDGSLTAGLALEGINNAGHLNKNLIVILNDNEMSISENVGALSSYLSRILTGDFYSRFRKNTENILRSLPRIGPLMLKMAKRMEEFLKSLITPGIIFEELGFTYIGPINGHDLPNLIETLKNIKKLTGPILIHVYTKKGKGYLPAENNPEIYHGVPPFDKDTGVLKKSGGKSYTDIFGETLLKMAEKDDRIIAITAAMRTGTGLQKFKEAFPERFFDVGIAEQHAVTFAAGLAVCGFRPYVAIYSTFLQRSIDMIIHDVCLQNLPVVFAVDRAGIVGEDGPTHHGQFDLSYLRMIPNLVLCAASDANELTLLIRSSVIWSKPTAVRYPRGVALEDKHHDNEKNDFIEIGKGRFLKEGKDAAIIGVGPVIYEALKAADILSKEGFDITVFDARFVKPLDEATIREILANHKIVFTLEENTIFGGFGSAILELQSRTEQQHIIKLLGLPDTFIEHGNATILRELYGLTAKGIAQEVLRKISD